MKKVMTLMFLLAIILIISGCISVPADTISNDTTDNDTVVIQSDEEATNELINVSTGVGDIGSTLDELDSLLE